MQIGTQCPLAGLSQGVGGPHADKVQVVYMCVCLCVCLPVVDMHGNRSLACLVMVSLGNHTGCFKVSRCVHAYMCVHTYVCV